MRVQVYYESGNYGVFETTLLSFQDGMLADDSFLDVGDLRERGIVVTRCTHLDEKTEEEPGRIKISEEIAVVPPAEVDEVLAVVVDGMLYLARLGGELRVVAHDFVLEPLRRGENI